MLSLIFALRVFSPDELYVFAARVSDERVTYTECAHELSELRGRPYNRKECERIFGKARAKVLSYAAVAGDCAVAS
jgi:hypothetical protein